jgi:hypothetical protein
MTNHIVIINNKYNRQEDKRHKYVFVILYPMEDNLYLFKNPTMHKQRITCYKDNEKTVKGTTIKEQVWNEMHVILLQHCQKHILL